MAPRRSHTKSRNGCVQCKQRRIKCDERAPTCTNCIKHSVQCNYLPRAKPATKSEHPASSVPVNTASIHRNQPCDIKELITSNCMNPNCTTVGCRNASLQSASHSCEYPPPMPDMKVLPWLPELQLSDLELLHHFSTETYKTFRNADSLRSIWKFAIPQLAFRFPYLMRSILATSALHLSYLRPAYRESYLLLATSHQNKALSAFRNEFNSAKKTNSEAAFCFASLVVVYAFASPKTPGSLGLAEPNSGTSEWVDLLRGVYLVLHESGNWLQGTPLQGLVIPARPAPPTPPPPVDNHEANARLIDLFRLCHSSGPVTPPSAPQDTQGFPNTPTSQPSPMPSPNQEGEVLQRTIFELQKSFFLVYSLLPGECVIDSVFRFPLCVPQAYIQMLSEKNPAALVILAHFCILINKIDNWWMQGWPDHMLRTIESLLDENWREWIKWPVSVVRGT